MTEPARFPLPRSRPRPAPPVEPPPPPTPAEQLAHRMRTLSALPSRAALLALTERDLPTTDGLAPPDLMFQEAAIGDTLLALRTALGHHPGVFVSGYTLVYDAPRAHRRHRGAPVWVVPDVLVAFGVGGHARLSYVIWREGKAPEFVLEVASVSTWRRDRDEKPALYASLGVGEYFLYDPVGGLLEPRLQGHRLRGGGGGGYRALRAERLGNGERGLRSETLGLWAWLEGPGQVLRWHDPATGRDLETHAEVLAAREAAEARAGVAEDRAEQEAAARQQEAAARQAAEARIAELEARLGGKDR